MTTLDVDFVRGQFPAFAHPDAAAWAHLENAGGSYVPAQVIDRLHHFFTATKVQPYWDFGPSRAAGEAMDEAKRRIPATFNAAAGEVHFGPSTTQNTYVLSHAFRAGMAEGDEVIVTNQDHEANIGAWRRLAGTGITVREFPVDQSADELEVADRLGQPRLSAANRRRPLERVANPLLAGQCHSCPHHRQDYRRSMVARCDHLRWFEPRRRSKDLYRWRACEVRYGARQFDEKYFWWRW